MASFFTYPELQERIGRRLGIIADTESLSAEDGDLIGHGLSFVESWLDTMGIYSLAVADGVNEPFATPVIMAAAAHMVDEFQIPEPRRSQLKAEGLLGLPARSLAERMLRNAAEAPTTKLQVAVDFSVP